MKNDVSLLNKHKFIVTNQIIVHIPTIREIRGNSIEIDGSDKDEAGYYTLINLFSATSSNIMVELEESGIDFTKWSDYKTFLMLFQGVPKDILKDKSHLLFENINLADFEVSINTENDMPIIYDREHDIIIDELGYMRLSTIFCTMNFIEKEHRKPADRTAREYIIERQKVKDERRKNKIYGSRFDKQIIALVNNCNFQYNFETVEDMTIYNFMVSLKQIIKKYQVDNLNIGTYMGTVKIKNAGNKLNWLDYE